MKSPKRRKSQRRALSVLGPVPQIISRIPRPYPRTPKQLGAAITTELSKIWLATMSPSQRERGPKDGDFSSQSFDKLDALILRQAETMGWRLALSELVHLRFSDWDFLPSGPKLFEQYGKALARSARRFQKQELPPVDPDLYSSKRETVEELRVLLRNLRNTFSKRRNPPTSKELIDYFQKTVSAEGAAFIYLTTNLDSWVQFFRVNSTQIRPILLGQRTSPGAIFDSWIAWSTGFEQETIRQKISQLGKRVNSVRSSAKV